MIRFGESAIDIDARELLLDGESQHLEPQAFDLLCYLLEHRDRVVGKAELLDEVWGDQFVSESALTTRIKEIRRATGDDGRSQHVIRNVRGHGYRFVAALHEPTHDHTAAARTRPRFPPTAAIAGRSALLESVLEELDRARAVTLLGPGGVGKTTLAIAAGRAWSGRHGDAIFVDLARLHTDDDPIRALREAIGVTSTATDDDVVRTAASMPALLVLDNCEHVVEAAAALVDEVLSLEGDVRFLATSRERLGVVGERSLVLDPLDSATATDLFIERASSVLPGFAPDVDDRARIERIVDGLDGLPLAIEMAASRMSAFGLVDLEELLAQDHGLLESPRHGGAARHRTLTDLIAWSEALLDPDDASTFAHLSVFAGPVPITDITGVLRRCEPSVDQTGAAAQVASLVDQSLLSCERATRPPRYRMLDTVKAHVAGRRPASTARAHAEWFLEQARYGDDALRGPDEHLAVAALQHATAEFRAAHTWFRAHDPDQAALLTGALSVFAHSRLWGEPARWAGLLPRDDSPEVLAALAADAAERSDYAAADQLSRAVLEQRDVAPRTKMSALETQADVGLFTGELDRSINHGIELQALAEAAQDIYAAVLGMSSQALALVYGGDVDAAIRIVDDFDASAGSDTHRAWVAYTRAECIGDRDPRAAMAAYREAIELAEPLGARYVTSVSRVSLAAALARSTEAEGAFELFGSIISSFREIGNHTHLVTTLRNLVELLERLEMDEPAICILAALSAPSVKTSFGAEAQRLEACRQRAEARRGSTAVAAWTDEAAGCGVLWAADQALRTIRSA